MSLLDKIKHDPAWASTPNEQGLYPVFIEAQNGCLENVKTIVEASKCSMNIVDRMNRTVLHYAAESNQVDLVEYLLDYVSENPFRGDANGLTAYDIALEKGNHQVVECFRRRFQFKLDQSYRNPIIRGFNPDPSIVNVGDDYFLVTSTFVYFPSIPIYHSKDLVNWSLIGHAVSHPEYSELMPLNDGRGFWAPDISYSDGYFYITATLRMNDEDDLVRRQMIVKSKLPQGPYSKPIYIDYDGIDPSLFHDTNGKHYMLINRGARLIELNESLTEAISEPQLIWYGVNKRAPEAPHLLKHNGYYYCFLSEGGTGRDHQISVARSKKITGPYEPCPYNPILKQQDSKAYLQRSGHGKLVKDHLGNWWIVYLASRPFEGEYSIMGRETCLDPVEWSSDGWPIVNGNKGPSVLQAAPVYENALSSITPSKPITCLGHDWIFVRTPDFLRIIQDYHKKVIRFYPDHLELSDKQKKNIYVIRKKENYGLYSFKLKANGMQDDCSFGIVIYYDSCSYVSMSLNQENDQVKLVLAERILYETSETKVDIDINKMEVDFRVKMSGLECTFYMLGENGDWKRMFSVPSAHYLSDEGIVENKRFTGTTIGVFGKAYRNNFNFSFDLLDYHIMEADNDSIFNR